MRCGHVLHERCMGEKHRLTASAACTVCRARLRVCRTALASAALACLSRAAAGLALNIDAANVVQTWRAAKMYMMQDLEEERMHYMEAALLIQ